MFVEQLVEHIVRELVHLLQSGAAGGVLGAGARQHDGGVRGGGARGAAQVARAQAYLPVPLT